MNTFKTTLRRKRLAARLLNYFLKGLLISIPLAATYWVIAWLFGTVDGIIYHNDPTKPPVAHIPGLGFLIVIGIILLIGFIGSSYLAKPFIDWFDEWMEKTPGVKFLYSSVKDIMEAFVGEKKKFSEPVLVEMNGEGIYRIGFITRKDMEKVGLAGHSGVYFPKSYGFVGDLYIVRNDKLKPMNVNPTEVFKMIVSGGVTGIDDPAA
ncbi:MAG: DUF502 domain-containing protein [Bacteroidota bacterium]